MKWAREAQYVALTFSKLCEKIIENNVIQNIKGTIFLFRFVSKYVNEYT